MNRRARKQQHPREGLLKAIAVFKIVKSLLLVAVGLGCFELLNPSVAAKAERWSSALAWRLGPQAGFAVAKKLPALHGPHLAAAGVFALAYAALFGVEGVGLWTAKRWAEYLTIVATSSFVPFEIYALVRHASWERGATLAVNLLVVAYLVWRVRHGSKPGERRRPKRAAGRTQEWRRASTGAMRAARRAGR